MESIDQNMIHYAAVVVLAVHLLKWIWESAVGMPLEVMFSNKFRKRQARALVEEIVGEQDSTAKRELIRILKLGALDHVTPSVASGYKDNCLNLLKKQIKQGTFNVGIKGTKFLRQKAFLDVLSASLDARVRSDLTVCLTSHFKAEAGADKGLSEIAGVIGLKRGSPWLAIEFANKLNIPIALHRGGERVNVGGGDPHDRFDGTLPAHGALLIVDDSITGGTMVLEAIEDIRKLHLDVLHCIVLFEVLGKDGRETLKKQGVFLHAICSFDGTANVLKTLN